MGIYKTVDFTMEEWVILGHALHDRKRELQSRKAFWEGCKETDVFKAQKLITRISIEDIEKSINAIDRMLDKRF